MRNWIILPFLLIVLTDLMAEESVSENLGGIKDTFVTIGDGLAKMASGFSAIGGAVPGSQYYNFIVFNGATRSITAQYHKYKSIMGAQTDNGMGRVITLGPGENSQNSFLHTYLYFAIEIPDAHFTENHFVQGVGNDPLIYLYHVFENGSEIKAELVSSALENKYLTSSFKGMIYNGASSSVPFTFGFTDVLANGSASFTATTTCVVTLPLESDVFHSLHSHNDMNFRPSMIATPGGSIFLGSQGLGFSYPTLDPVHTVTLTKVDPMTYNYEILPNKKLIETGFRPGNFRPPSNGKLRDITPIRYSIWNQGLTDFINTDTTEEMLQPLPPMPTQSLWVIYTGQGYSSVKNAITNGVLAKIPTGKALSFYLFRPTYKRKKEILYIVWINSFDDESAIALLQQMQSINIPRYDLPTFLNTTDVSTLFASKLPDSIGQFTLGSASGYILYQRTFTNFSISAGPYYCTASAPLYDTSLIAGTIMQYIDPLKLTEDLKADISKKVINWIPLFITNKALLSQQIQSYLLRYGDKSLLDNSRSLNVLGNLAIFMIMYGPSGVSTMPLLYLPLTDVTPEPIIWADQKNMILF